jgi:hypothetical protein
MIVFFAKYYLGEQIKKNRIGGGTGTYAGQDKCIQDLVGKSEGKIQLERPRHRWEDNINADLEEIHGRVWTGSIWIWTGASECAVVNVVMILQVQ